MLLICVAENDCSEQDNILPQKLKKWFQYPLAAKHDDEASSQVPVFLHRYRNTDV